MWMNIIKNLLIFQAFSQGLFINKRVKLALQRGSELYSIYVQNQIISNIVC